MENNSSHENIYALDIPQEIDLLFQISAKARWIAILL